MQLKILAAAISPRQIIGPLDRVVDGIAYDSRRVQRNFLFVALRGEKTDGHQFIDQAVEKGASVIVTEREEKQARATCLVVENTRPVLADLAATFYERPARRLKLAAVTGTNGKTTTTFLIKHIREKAGVRCGLHGTMENYFEAKMKLFAGLAEQTGKTKPVAVINIDDRYGAQLVDRLDKKISVITYGVSVRADFRASNYHAEFAGTSYQLDAHGKSYLVRVPLIGRFNVANYMGALAAACGMGLGLREAILSLSRSPQVPGRLEAVPAKRQFQVFVDYAHTDDALLNVMKTL